MDILSIFYPFEKNLADVTLNNHIQRVIKNMDLFPFAKL